uniref:PHD-type domain-containing protein n=1 Tax=Macrostomum lignano TaxID=282301 RepID=A0A1I8H1X8_9PLAT
GKDEEPHPDAWAGQAETLLSSRYCRALQLASVEPGAARIRGAAAEPPVVHFYSCDYCSFCTEYDGQAAVKLTHEHLSAAGHDSASRYGRTEDGRVAVANPGQLVAPSRSRRAAESNRLAIVCPSCLLQFDSKFACGLHHLLHHGGQLACYTVLPVLASRQVSFTPAHLCKPCGREFRLADELHRHWAGGSACCPFASPVAHQRPVLVRVACPHCRLQFASLLPPAKSADKSAAREAAGAMFAARKHIVALHAERSAGSHSALLHMRATFFGLGSSSSTRTRVLAVPPLTQRSACDSLLYCIKLAKEIRAQVDRNCPSGCVLSERLRAEIAELQKPLQLQAAPIEYLGDRRQLRHSPNMNSSGEAGGLQRCFWRSHSGTVLPAEILGSQPGPGRQKLLLLRLSDTGQRRLARARDTWPCRSAPAGACQKCRQKAAEPAALVCQECRNVYHRHCGLLDPAQTEGYPSGFFRCRNCCFRLAVGPLGAASDGRDGRMLRAVKRQLEYSVAQLSWPSDLENSDNVYCYCGGPGNAAYGMLRCIACKQHFHLACLQDLPDWMRHGLVPWDRFYAFLCACCNEFEPQPGTEFVHRLPLRWPDLVHMGLLNLAATSEGSGFHWARHVTPWLRSVWHRLYVSNLRMADLETQVVQSLSSHTKRFQPVVMTTGDTLYRPICPLRPPVVTPPQPGSHLARVNWAARISYAPPRGDLPPALLRDPAAPGPEEADAIAAATAAAVSLKPNSVANNNNLNSKARKAFAKPEADSGSNSEDSCLDVGDDQLQDADFKPGSSGADMASLKSAGSPQSSSAASQALTAGRAQFGRQQRRNLQQQQRRRGRPLLNLPRRRPDQPASTSAAAAARGAKRVAADEDAEQQPASKRRRGRKPQRQRQAAPRRQQLVEDSDGELAKVRRSGILDSDSDEQSYHSADFNTSEDDSGDEDFVVRGVGGSRRPRPVVEGRQRRGRGRPPSASTVRLQQQQQRRRQQQRLRLNSSDLDSVGYIEDGDGRDDIDDDEDAKSAASTAGAAAPDASAAAAGVPDDSGRDDVGGDVVDRPSTQPKPPPPPPSRLSPKCLWARPASRLFNGVRASAPSAQPSSSTCSPTLPSPPIRSVADSAASVLSFIPPAQRHPFRLPWELPVHTDVRVRRSLWLQVHALMPPPPPPELPAKLSELEARLDVACRSRQGSPRKLLIGQLMGTRERRLPDGKTTVDSLFRWW